MQEQLTPDQFGAKFPDLFRKTAFRLETLACYQSSVEEAPFRRFLTGEADDLQWRKPWLDLVRAAVATGKTVARVHVVDEPLSDYLLFELKRIYPSSVEAGEDIRVVAASDLDLLSPDFWLVDDWLATMAYTPTGRWLGVDLTDDSAAVADHRAWRDILLRNATPLGKYMMNRIQSRRKTA